MALALVLGLAHGAAAQAPAVPRVEVSGGIGWIGAVDFGEAVANETTPGGGTRPLFRTQNQLDSSVGGTLTLGIRLSGMFRAEAAVAYNPTSLSTRISDDAEGAADTVADAPVTQFLFEGGLVIQPKRWTRGRRVAPFIAGGAGYLRQLNDGRTLVETGHAIYVGGGLYYVRASSRPRKLKASGVRLDVRALLLRDGVAPDAAYRVAPALTASVFARF
jgi:hypothetical protein